MKKIISKTFLIVFICITPIQIYALDFIYTKNGFFAKGNEYAIQGFDAVSYFTDNQPNKGNPQFSAEYQGKKWHFKDAKNLSLFKMNPKKYAPQYGGHCAWRMGVDGEGVYGDPNIWTIRNDKLYLNYNQEVNNRWVKDIPNFIKKADSYWLGKNQFKSLN